MDDDRTGFLLGLQSDAGVAVAGRLPDKWLGVRDGFRRVIRDALGLSTGVEVTAYETAGSGQMPLSDAGILTLALERAHAVRVACPATPFVVGSEAGVARFEVGGTERWVIRTWTVVLAFGTEAWGSSGSLELPPALIRGLDPSEVAMAVPGTRRHGGAVAALSRGLEDRRGATAAATANALLTLFYTASGPGAGRL